VLFAPVASVCVNTRVLQFAKPAGIIAGMLDLILLIAAGATIGTDLLGLVAIYNALGMAALWLAVGLLYVLYFALERRGAGYFDPGGAFGGGGPALPPSNTQRLQRPGQPKIGHTQGQALPRK
jgi:hypothetical protein